MALARETSYVASKAADLIEQEGFAKHILIEFNGALCFNGAVMKAVTGQDPTCFPGFDSVAYRMVVEIGTKALHIVNTEGQRQDNFVPFRTIADWNNQRHTTKDQAIGLLRRCAKELA